ncbi:hypothetical protein D8X55_04110 [Malacoplasma penetrans]|uniref:hypothetical protein n=1 Tax=Malacoplasma penetrans TaxID=28227 RepID=UPI001010EE2F|nr:hypothetical protein [Malacoplasma penetrans]RXY96315.1 hypothetical protein D8X55_04110 [Malacoplasma penetrans]
MSNLKNQNFNKILLEQQLINKVKIIKNNIRVLNARKMRTNLLHEKQEYSIRIQNLEYELSAITNILVNKIHSKKTIDSLIRSNKKDLKEIDYLLKNIKLSDKDYLYLLSKKMDLNLFISEISRHLINAKQYNVFPKRPNVNRNVFKENRRASTEPSIEELRQMLLEKTDGEISRIIRDVPESIIKQIWGNINSNNEVIIKEMPVEVVREIPVEVIKEIPVEVVREIEIEKEVIREIPVEVIREIEIEREVIKEVPVEIIRDIKIGSDLDEFTLQDFKNILLSKSSEEISEIVKDIPENIVTQIWGNLSSTQFKEIIREIPVEVIKEIPIEKEIIKEVYVDADINNISLNDLKNLLLNKSNEEISEIIKEVPESIVAQIWGHLTTTQIQEIIKEIPVEVVKEVEVIKEIPVEVVKEIEVIKEVPIEIIKEVEVEKEVVKEVAIEVVKETPPITVYKEITVPIEVVKEVKIFVGPDGNLYDDEGRTKRIDLALTDEMLNNMGIELYQAEEPIVFDETLNNRNQHLEEHLSQKEYLDKLSHQQLNDTVDYAEKAEIITMNDMNKLYENNKLNSNNSRNESVVNRNALAEDGEEQNDLEFDSLSYDFTDI